MRTAGLPTFTKLYGRNDTDPMQKGTYRIIIGLNFPVIPYKGTKSFVISTVSWIGGKNPFLGWAYVAAASVFVLLAIMGTARHLIKPNDWVICLFFPGTDSNFGFEHDGCIYSFNDSYPTTTGAFCIPGPFLDLMLCTIISI